MSREYNLYLLDIFEAIERIERYTRGIDYDEAHERLNRLKESPEISFSEVILKFTPQKTLGDYP